MAFDALSQYLLYVMGLPIGKFSIPFDGVHAFGTDIISLIIDKSGSFQTELFIVPGEWSFEKEHRHPNMDSFEVHLTGEIFFKLNGKRSCSDDDVKLKTTDGRSAMFGKITRVFPTDFHGAYVSKTGGSFLSVQHWLNGIEPSSAGKDWIGEPVNIEHKKILQNGESNGTEI